MADEVFDPAAHILKRNEAQANRIAGKPEEVKKPESAKAETKAEAKEHEDGTGRPGRRAQREIDRLREEAAELRGRLAVIQELGVQPKTTKSETNDDPEPDRKDFATDAEYQRAAGRWDARQEAKKEVGKVEERSATAKQQEEWRAHVAEMDKKAATDKDLIEDWEETAEAALEAEEDDPDLKWSAETQPTFMAMIYESDVRAFMLHHYAKNPEDLRKILAAEPQKQISMFKRLEGRVEMMYSSEKKEAPVVQAGDKGNPESKERTVPEKAEKARETAAERDARKSRPTSEVAARGGSAPPDEPKIGSAAWMAARNAKFATTRY